MIEIIKNAMTDPIKIECVDCQSIFTYTYKDIRTGEHTNIFGTVFYNRFVECPVCRYRNDIKHIRKQEAENDSSK